MRCRCVVFDLDGTLVDTAPDLAHALNQLMIEHGHQPFELPSVIEMIGQGIPKIVERGLVARGIDIDALGAEGLGGAVLRYKEIYAGCLLERTRPYPDIVETLERLKARGLSLSVCTNKLETFAVEILDGLDLSRYFDVVVGGHPERKVKPDPAPLEETVRAIRAEPWETVVIGDSPADITAARALNMRSILMTYGYNADKPEARQADLVLDRAMDIPDAVAQLALAETN